MSDTAAKAIPGFMLWVIWAALFMAVAVYLLVVQLGDFALEEGAPAVDKSFSRTLAAVSCVLLAISFGIRMLVTRRQVRGPLETVSPPVLTTCLISWALAEAVGIFGMILGTMGYPTMTYGGFFLASFSAMIFLLPVFPRQYESILRQQ